MHSCVCDADRKVEYAAVQPTSFVMQWFDKLCHAGKLAGPCSGSVGSREDSDAAIEFCNTPEGYCEMGKQLGIAFAALFNLS